MSKKNKRFGIDGLEQTAEDLINDGNQEAWENGDLGQDEEFAVVSSRQEPAPKITFEHWFDKALKAGKVRHYQDEALLVFFKKQGLKNTEIEDQYNKAFKNF